MNLPIKNDRATWILGPSAKCSIPPEHFDRPWRLVLLGAPGVGKGTQAEFFSQRLGGCHLATGDVFRAAATGGDCETGRSPAMEQALVHMRRGDLVPDSTVWELIRERSGCMRCHGGFVLDGFPRTLAQAIAFQQLLKEQEIQLDGVIDYELSEEEIVGRISGRRVCRQCKAVFHESLKPPKSAGICDTCASPLIQREDDRPEAVKVRLQTYRRDTAPLIEFYRELHLLVPVRATGTPEEVFTRSLAALETAMTDGALRSRNPTDARGLYSGQHDIKTHEELL
jgi:adenylate kinase